MASTAGKNWAFFKRIFDIFASALGLVLLSPIFLVVALLVKMGSRGPVFFRQERVGRGFRKFLIYKFRTMVESGRIGEEPSIFWQNHRITWMGHFLRNTKIDELPQLINVLKGEMSLVGPRPELEMFVQMFKGKYAKILSVRPGITDLASLEYNNEEEILKRSVNPESEYTDRILPEKIRLALVYIDKSSFFLDLQLIFRTIIGVKVSTAGHWKNSEINSQGFAFLFTDAILGLSSFYLAYFLRYEGAIPQFELGTILYLLPFIFVSRSLAFVYYRFYSRFWQYSSLDDLILVLKGVGLGSFFLLISIFMHSNPPISIPRTVPIIDFILMITLVGGSRMAWRLWIERQKQKPLARESGIRVLIFGAGDMGAILLKNLRHRVPHFTVCGFIDDNQKVKNKTLMGVNVLGNRYDIPKLASELKIKEILIASNHISSGRLSEIVEICGKSMVKFKIVSSVTDISTNEIHLSKIRKIEISDLLGRDSVSLDLSSIKNMIGGKRVLVTGAGGSIGSELSHQILKYNPSDLIMLDRGENYLHELNINSNLVALPENSNTKKHFKFCSITNRQKMESIFQQHRPQIVFHAAANKHVPLMEANVDEAVINNVYGTKITADFSDKYGVERFVLVSTDKVVRPTSIMGTTKKIAENYIQFLNQRSETKFLTVRFGNVLGSKGSVIPLFQTQIENGGPVTVTHPDMTRYFMLIPEAVQLMVQAATIGEGGEIFILEMGDPVKIVDLAHKMIRLSGYEPNRDIEVNFTGIRPGEKMYEELLDDFDKPGETYHKKIKVLLPQKPVDDNYDEKINELFQVAITGDIEKIKLSVQNLLQEVLLTQSSE